MRPKKTLNLNSKIKQFKPPPIRGPMGMRLYQLLLICAFLHPPSAMSQINLRNGAFTKTWQDWHIHSLRNMASPPPNHPLKITRTYNSRSLTSGIFGFGWCAHIEDRLITKNKTYFLEQCLTGRQIEVKISRKGKKLLRELSNGQIQEFNLEGRLIKWRSAAGNMAIQYDFKQRIGHIYIEDQKDRVTNLVFIYRKNSPLVHKILIHNRSILYHYKLGRLTKVSDHLGFIYRYSYNKFDNLTTIHHGKSIHRKITYDNQRDLVTQIQQINGCMQSVKYSSLSEKDYSTEVTKKCPEQQPHITYNEYWHSKVGKEIYLSKFKTQSRSGQEDKGRISFYSPQGKLTEQHLWGDQLKFTVKLDDLGRIKEYQDSRNLLMFLNYKNKMELVPKQVKLHQASRWPAHVRAKLKNFIFKLNKNSFN